MDKVLVDVKGLRLFGNRIEYRERSYPLADVLQIGLYHLLHRLHTNYVGKTGGVLDSSVEQAHIAHLLIDVGPATIEINNSLRQAADTVVRKAVKLAGIGFFSTPNLLLAGWVSKKLAGDPNAVVADMTAIYSFIDEFTCETRIARALDDLASTGSVRIHQRRLTKTYTLRQYPDIVFAADGSISVGSNRVALQGALVQTVVTETGTDAPYFTVINGKDSIELFSGQCNVAVIEYLFRKFGAELQPEPLLLSWRFRSLSH